MRPLAPVRRRRRVQSSPYKLSSGTLLLAVEFETAATAIRDAYKGEPLVPLREYREPPDAAGAYEVQEINTSFCEHQGRRIAGRNAWMPASAARIGHASGRELW